MTRSEQRVYRLAGALSGGVVLVGSLAALAAAPGKGKSAARWSAPAVLEACAGRGPAAIAFPDDNPAQRTGEGALVWEQGAACPGGSALRLAALGARERVAREELIGRTRDDVPPAIDLTGAQAGRVLLASTSVLREGPARGGLDVAAAVPAPRDVALATAYRGQPAALYALPAGRGSALLLHRGALASARAGATRVVSTPAPVGALAVALDYRTDAIAVWQQGASLYARSLPRSAPAAPQQRIGGCGERAQLTALISDDRRAIVAWMTRAHGDTRVYAAVSQPGVRFGVPTLLASYRDPHGAEPPAGSLRLVRLSDERVLLAWPGVLAGHYVVRVAHVAVSGIEAPLTIAAPGGGDALLADLAPGPRADALVLWTQGDLAPERAQGSTGQALLAAYGGLSVAGRPQFGAAEGVGADVGVGSARAAFDPDSDRAIAVWRTSTGALASATREPDAAHGGDLAAD